MTTPPPPVRTPPRPVNAAPASAPVGKLDMTPRAAKKPCPRIALYGVEGFGKTTIGANAPAPVIFAARDEKGVQPLIDAGLIRDTPVIDCPDWTTTLNSLDSLISDPQGRKSVVLDSIGSFERLAHEHVCTTKFGGEWGEGGFASYGKGVAMGVTEWLKMLQRLDQLNAKGMIVILLAHSTVKTFKNPSGADFDQYQVNAAPQTWDTTGRWADAVLFGKFESVVEIGGKKTGNIAKDKGKGIGGTDRVIYTERRDAFVAKNRYGMPPEIPLSGDRTQSWAELWQHIEKVK